MDYKTKLKALIKEKSFTYKTIAEQLNTTEGTVKVTLNGKNSMQINTAQRYAEVLGIPFWQLFVEPGEQTETIRYAPTAICPHCGKPVQIKLE